MKFLFRTKALACAFATLCLVPAHASAEDMRMAVSTHEKHPWTQGAQHFAELVHERTDGELNIRVFHSGQLGNDRVVIDGMRLGAIDFQIGGASNATEYVPELQIFGIPYLFEDVSAFKRATSPDSALFAELAKSFDESGVGIELLGITGGNVRYLFNKDRPVRSVEDLAGLKMRVSGSPISEQLWSEMGTTTVSVPYAEMYSALQTGVAEASEASIAAYSGSKFYELAPYLSPTQHEIYACHFSVSSRSWDDLSEEHRTIVKEAALEASDYAIDLAAKDDKATIQTLVDDHGVIFVDDMKIDSFRDTANGIKSTLAEANGVAHLLRLIGG